jgi:hypothetical protein
MSRPLLLFIIGVTLIASSSSFSVSAASPKVATSEDPLGTMLFLLLLSYLVRSILTILEQQQAATSSMNTVRRVIVEGYSTCGYYQAAMKLWNTVAETHPALTVVTNSQSRDRADYQKFLAEKTKVSFISYSTHELELLTACHFCIFIYFLFRNLE